uniref:C2H2-type domain-containing protein n=1 Tax=Timema bartmani TaxID=61472 RepID=A0A7R9I478_9NEOP|nr:unnamed protein product [Timema bartmani]
MTFCGKITVSTLILMTVVFPNSYVLSQVREDDFKPKQVCFTCVSKLEMCVDLVELSLSAEFKFDSILQTRFGALKTLATDSSQIQTEIDPAKAGGLGETSIGCLPLFNPRATRGWSDDLVKADHGAGNTVTVQHDGSVIVLGKVDSEHTHGREDCQDILLMVELKYKDIADSIQTGLLKAAPTIAYAIDPTDASLTKTHPHIFTETDKTHNLAYANEIHSISGGKTLTYTVEAEQDSSPKTYSLTYSTDPLPESAAGKPQTLTFTADEQQLLSSKTHTFEYTVDQQHNTLEKQDVSPYSEDTHSIDYATIDSDSHPGKIHMMTYSTETDAVTKSQILARSLSNAIEEQAKELAFSEKANETLATINGTPVLLTNDANKTHRKRSQLLSLMEAGRGGGDPVKTGVDNRHGVIVPKLPAAHVLLAWLHLEDTVMTAGHNLAERLPTFKSHLYKDTDTDQTTPPQRPEKPFPCTICSKGFMRRTNLNAHMAVHTQVRPHVCDQCGKRFVVRWDLTLHQRIHSGLFSCEFCDKAFSVRAKLERHRRMHTGERPYPCPTCGKAFGEKRNLESHQRTHSGERPFICNTCGKTFRVRSHLTDHRRVHTQETPFTCDICGKSFKWKTNLNIHLKTHTGERFPCVDCGREFARRSDLLKHRRNHSADRSHVCGICGKGYNDKAMLQKHLKSHSDDKPYTCDVCGKSFHFHWYLSTHKKTHVEDKEDHLCGDCGKLFYKKGNLVAHTKLCHSDTHTVIM